MADKVTAVFGSWGFIVTQSVLIVIWLGYNGYAALHYLHSSEFDPYPFILLNLLFSTQAAYAAPLILLSQNRRHPVKLAPPVQPARRWVELEVGQRSAVECVDRSSWWSTSQLHRRVASSRLSLTPVRPIVHRDHQGTIA